MDWEKLEEAGISPVVIQVDSMLMEKADEQDKNGEQDKHCL